MTYKGKKIVIMGLGLYPQGSGMSALKFLHARGARLVVTDLRKKQELAPQLNRLRSYPSITYVLGRHRMSDFISADMIIKNPAVPANSEFLCEARKRKIPIHSDITLFMQECRSPIIGITGTRGKSTTATLLHMLLKQHFPHTRLGGNITVSPLSFVRQCRFNQPIVLELSSWQLNSLQMIRQSPQMAIVTNMMIDHLNTYPSFAAYRKDKEYIWKYQQPDHVVILNKDNEHTRGMGDVAHSRIYWFSRKSLGAREYGLYQDREGYLTAVTEAGKVRLCHTSKIRLVGEHNITNVMAAALAAYLSGVTPREIARGIAAFRGVSSRLEPIRKVRGVTYVNDTTATTPDATIAALRSYKRAPLLIAGGTNKALVFDELAREINKRVQRLYLLPGTATNELIPLLDTDRVDITLVGSMDEAVRSAAKYAQRGDIVLLSPGAASFGLFVNEFDRGAAFIRAVRQLE